MKLKSKFQKGESLAESVVSIAIFGILLLGLTDFMSSQIQYIARLHHRDSIVNKAQILAANNVFENLGTESFLSSDNSLSDARKTLESLASFDWYAADEKYGKEKRNFLRVYHGFDFLDFAIPK